MMKTYGPLTTVESGAKLLYFAVDGESGVVSCMRQIGDRPTLLTIKHRDGYSFSLVPVECGISLGYTFTLVGGMDAEWKITTDLDARLETVVDEGDMFDFLAECFNSPPS